MQIYDFPVAYIICFNIHPHPTPAHYSFDANQTIL